MKAGLTELCSTLYILENEKETTMDHTNMTPIQNFKPRRDHISVFINTHLTYLNKYLTLVGIGRFLCIMLPFEYNSVSGHHP